VSRLLFILTSISFIVLTFGYFNTHFTEINIWIRTGWAGLYFVILTLVFSAAWFLVWHVIAALRKVAWLKEPRPPNSDRTWSIADTDRRGFLKISANAGLSMVSGAVTVVSVIEGMRTPEIIEIGVPIKNLPDEQKNFRIVQISDLHVNTTTKVEWVRDIVAKVNSLSPDIVAFTGDFADNVLADIDPILKPFTGLSSRFGNYFVTGNHEYSYSHGIIVEGGVSHWKRKIENFGFRVLLNENRILSVGKSRLLLAGVTDYYAGLTISAHESNSETALRNAPSHDVKILLAHQPKSIYQTAGLDFDLQLSGRL